MKRTGIFGGSFNPIHNGHINLAQNILKQGLADEIWLMVTPHNPLKPQKELLDEYVRLRMARCAVHSIPCVEASDFEFRLPRPSYSWQTLRELKNTFPERSFVLIIGADNWKVFSKWKNSEDILKEHEIIVYPRPGYEIEKDELPDNVHLIEAPLFEWNSSQIREKLANGEDITGMTPPEIADIIQTNNYYQK